MQKYFPPKKIVTKPWGFEVYDKDEKGSRVLFINISKVNGVEKVEREEPEVYVEGLTKVKPGLIELEPTRFIDKGYIEYKTLGGKYRRLKHYAIAPEEPLPPTAEDQQRKRLENVVAYERKQIERYEEQVARFTAEAEEKKKAYQSSKVEEERVESYRKRIADSQKRIDEAEAKLK